MMLPRTSWLTPLAHYAADLRHVIAGASPAPIARGVLSGVIALLLNACAGRASPPPLPRPTVTVVTLHASPVSLTTELPGRVSSYRVAEVRPQVGGVVLKRLFAEGDRVSAGQQLYLIDPAPYEASLASAQASLAHAHAAVAVAKLTAERYKSLVEVHAVSGQDYDNAIATLEQDEADVATAQASVRTAQINLAYTRVYSPISGRTGRSSVTEGALVTANQTTSLVTVTQLDPVYVDLTQPTTTILRFKRELASGQIRSAGANKTPARLLLEDGTRYDLPGTLQFSEVTVDQGTGSLTLRAIFPNPNDLLLPGMFVRATIEEGVREGAILAPQQGITHAPDGTATALVVGANDTVELRTLELGQALGDQWVVTQGFHGGDRLIVGGLQRVHPGMQVAVRDAAPPVTPTSPAVAPTSSAEARQLAAR
ncbi:MAG TPA: efflux RND transporter periplasmic adaptor subunit [Steroidobacteraceae bacterium]|nr:efflux RND transporter periplasmic adaptor subunit [Steroidobacteraceae bacterium]